LHIAKFDFETHTFSINKIVNNATMQTSQYQEIQNIVENELYGEQSRYNVNYVNHVNEESSLLELKRSILIYIPPLIVMKIMINTIQKCINL